MRRLSLLFAVLFVLALLGSDSQKEYDDKTESVGLEGTWRLTEFEFDGQKSKTAPGNQEIKTIRDEAVTSRYPDGAGWQGSYRINSTGKPPRLDWIGEGDRFQAHPVKCIFQCDGDTLRIAFMLHAGDR